MATTQTEIQSQVIGLSAEAFGAFCEDISGRFGVDMECSQQKPRTETVKGLNKRFKKLAAVNSIESEGTLNGNFQIVFDKEGLFTLAGVIVMLPEQKILQNRKRGSAKKAEEMADAVKEAGNMLVGSWDRIFRSELKGHGHFVQTNTFIGNPWDDPEEKTGLAGDEEFLFVPYEMTIGSYPPFNCGVIFPKTIFGDTSVSDAEAAAAEDEKNQEEPQEPQDSAEKADSKEADTTGKNDSEESKSQAPADENTVESVEKTSEQPVEAEQETPDENRAESEEAIAEETGEVEIEPEETSEPTGPTDGTEPATGPVSETIQKMTQSSADLPGEGGLVPLAMCAQDIMEKEVVWGDGDDSVQQALTKMQEADTGYMMVGTEGSLDGIVSTFDITSALSVYLKPMFSKWRRPTDDATLQIKIKWIMSRPVRTIKPETSLTAIMENMRETGLRCFPVADQQGNVAGLVTVFDIFKALLNTESDISTAGKTPEAPSLV
jgi:CBS domain-containing protein